MLFIIVAVLSLGILAAIFGLIRERKLKKMLERGEIEALPEIKEIENPDCCGQHAVCESNSLLSAVSKNVEYYDDEELDEYIGRASDDYNKEETEAFRDVLYTLQDHEVAGWLRSLSLRGVELPQGVKDEALLIVGERR